MKRIDPRDVFGIIAIAFAIAFAVTMGYGVGKVISIQLEK